MGERRRSLSRSNPMSDPVTWAAVGMAAVSNMATWLVILKRGNSDNKKLKPGLAGVCIERGEKIVKLETEQDNFKQDIQEIKGDLKDIKKAVIMK